MPYDIHISRNGKSQNLKPNELYFEKIVKCQDRYGGARRLVFSVTENDVKMCDLDLSLEVIKLL